MKKLFSITALILAAVMLFVSLGGCTLSRKPSPLTVYYVNIPIFSDAVISYKALHQDTDTTFISFNDAADMDRRITAELEDGSGPDIMLFDAYQTTLDVRKMAQNGAFADLRHSFDSLELYDGFLDAGKVGGKQYLLPMAFDIPSLYTSEERLLAENVTLDPEYYTFSDLSAAILQLIDAYADDDDRIVMVDQLHGGALMKWIDMAGVDILDAQRSEVAVEPEDLKEIAELAAAVDGVRDKMISVAKKFARDFNGIVEASAFLAYDRSFALGAMYYDRLYPEKMDQTFRLVTVPDIIDPLSVNAIVPCFGAVASGVKNQQGAVELLSELMQWSTTHVALPMDATKYPTFAIPENNRRFIAELAPLQGCEDELVRTIENTLGSIRSFRIPDPAVSGIVDAAFAGYFSGTAGFDECFEEMTAQLETYMTRVS